MAKEFTFPDPQEAQEPVDNTPFFDAEIYARFMEKERVAAERLKYVTNLMKRTGHICAAVSGLSAAFLAIFFQGSLAFYILVALLSMPAGWLVPRYRLNHILAMFLFGINMLFSYSVSMGLTGTRAGPTFFYAIVLFMCLGVVISFSAQGVRDRHLNAF